MPSKGRVQVGRLAMRHEGEAWNAYYAMEDTMIGAIPLGSIRIGAIAKNPTRKQAFMEMMQDIVADLIQEKTGHRPIWGSPTAGPEHERAGHA